MPGEATSPTPPPSGAPPMRTTGGTTLWTPPSPDHLQRLLPQYEIISMVGRGGMGAVYKGRQISLDRFVAIKILPPEALAGNENADFTDRFKNEARSMAKMNHPAIVGVYDFGETSEGQLYIVMEFVDATDVAQMIKSQGRLPPEHALAITAHVCDALHYAHSHGVIHRDIKPANVLMNMEGQVKIADFGLAKAMDPGAMAITKTNMAMGTPDFIAPEALITGLLVDHRADLYALGVMLYNMLAGKVPRGVFAPASKLVGSDPRFDAIVTKAMQTEREDRYQSATELRRDLDVILTVPVAKEQPESQSQGPPSRARKPVSRGPQPRNDDIFVVTHSGKTADERNVVAPKKSSVGLLIGIVTAAVLAAAAFFVFKKSESSGSVVEASASQVAAARVDDAFMIEVAAAPPERQVELVAAKIKAINGTPVKATPVIKDGKVSSLALGKDGEGNVPDISPVAALKDLTQLRVYYLNIQDISCLRGLKLQSITIHGGSFKDIAVLRDMPLKSLEMRIGPDEDYSILSGKPIENLDLGVGGLTSISFIKGMPVSRLNIERTKVKDLSPLRGLPLKELVCDFVPSRDSEILRSIATLTKINNKPVADFWRDVGTVAAPAGSAPPARQTIDLLSLTDPVMDRIFTAKGIGNNEWVREGAALAFKGDGKGGKLAPPVAFHCRDYEMEFRAERSSGTDRIHLDVPLAKGRILPLIFNDQGRKVIHEKEGRAWGPGGSVVHVTARVKLSADGSSDRIVVVRQDTRETLADWTGSFDKLGKDGEPHPAFPAEPITSVYVLKDPYTVKVWTLRVFEGDAKVLRDGGAAIASQPALPPSGVVNLLALVEVKRDGIEGDWNLKNGELHGSGGYARLAFDYRPPEEYDFRIGFTRLAGVNAVTQHVALGGHDVMWLLGGFGNSMWGFEEVGGKSGKDNLIAVKSGIESGRRYDSTVKVRRDGLQVVVDGKPVVDFKTDGSDLSVFKSWRFPDPNKLGVGCQNNTVFHSIELIPVSRDDRATKITDAPPGGSPPIVSTPSSGDSRLAQLEAGFKARYETDARKPYLAAFSALNQSYLRALANARTQAQGKGALAEIKWFDEEKARIEKDEGLPDEDDNGTPVSLVALRKTYRESEARHAADRDKKAAPLYDLYVRALDAYIVELAKADKLEDARTVKAMRDDIATNLPAPPDMGTAKVSGAKSIFDGRTLEGWRESGGTAVFLVEDGAIKTARGGGDLFYVGTGAAPVELTNLDLSMKVKTGPQANSGVWIHAPSAMGGGRSLALEVQIANEQGDSQKTGSIYGVKPLEKLIVHDGKWFDLRVVVKGRKITVYLNNKRVNDWTQPANWQPPAKVANARLGKGLIGLQGNAGEIWFKDIRLTVP